MGYAIVTPGGFCGIGRQGPGRFRNRNPVKPPTYRSAGAPFGFTALFFQLFTGCDHP